MLRQRTQIKGITQRQNGMWVGNPIPLGPAYDSPEAAKKRLWYLLKHPEDLPSEWRLKARALYKKWSGQPEAATLQRSTTLGMLPSVMLRRQRKLREYTEPKSGRQRYVPDMIASLAHVKKSKAMYRAFSFTQFLSIHGKFVASKDSLLHCWKILRKRKFGDVDADLESMVKHARKLMVSCSI